MRRRGVNSPPSVSNKYNHISEAYQNVKSRAEMKYLVRDYQISKKRGLRAIEKTRRRR
ncbi:uncharacterized protein G2W53_002280 [Senna tora]|uniref:Uncharacterized protein n=1 Tax=Senna tora TaxID=362788 RepID=A0A834XJ07_9FABA|nr:uncharacterized protein G2W53_002280 [Senna tora]